METEIWKELIGFDCLYKVSSLGRIIKLECNYERILMGYEYPNGYLRVNLRINGKRKQFYMHRIVALIFIPNPEDKRTVNHKDGVKINNRVDNLEWATDAENVKHSFSVLKRKGGMTGKFGSNHNRSKEVYCVTLNKRFGSAHEASRETGCNIKHISKVCLGQRKTSRGHIFIYVNKHTTAKAGISLY